jgi:branched-chain amino acid transport system ATP-binding protein
MAISGILKIRQGTIAFRHRPIHGLPSHDIVGQRICHVPEGRKIFPRLTVLENLEMGAYTMRDGAAPARLEQAFDLFPILKDRRNQPGGTLSGGEQQMLAIGRALMGRPSLLLLDEPSLGLSPIMVEQLGNAITAIRHDVGASVLLVEQNAGLALELTSRVYVMQTGRVTLSRPADQISAEELRHAYLGHTAARQGA